MCKTSLTAQFATFILLAATAFVCCPHSTARAQQSGRQPVHFQVSGPSERLEMIVNTSRILTLNFQAPRMLVNNPAIITAQPLAPNQIQVSARQPGITEINIWDQDNNVHSIDVLVYGDARELQNLLDNVYPDAEIEVRPSNGSSRSSVILSGYVPRADAVSRIVTIAQDFYPNVINNMEVGGVQTVLLHVKVMEVSRTKLRQLGVDWVTLFNGDMLVQGVNGLVSAAAAAGGALTGGGSVQVTLFSGTDSFGTFIDALRQNNLAKLLAEPTLVTVSGRPASFNSGGEIPVPVSAGLGVTTVEFREFGTNVDFVPIVLGNGKIRLEVRPQITEIAPDLRDAVTGTPGFRNRRVDTAVEMSAGQTLALAGLIQRRVEAENLGLPGVSELPWIGGLFRRVREQVNEVELMIMVTPELVAPMDAHEVPPCGPGQLTGSPTNVELYGRGYIETPKCCNEGGAGAVYSGPSFAPAPGMQPTFNGQSAPINGANGNGMQPTPESLPPMPQAPPDDATQSSRRQPVGNQYIHTGYASPASNRRVAAEPIPRNPYRQQNQANTARTTQPAQRAVQPKLFGPVGYDVLK